MSVRPYTTYEEQKQLLEIKNIHVPTEHEMWTLIVLKTHSYHGIVNGFKNYFNHTTASIIDSKKEIEYFYERPSLFDFHKLQLLDSDINNLLFKYIIYVEKSLKTKLSHVVARTYGVDIDTYLYHGNYRNNGPLDRVKECENIKEQINTNKNSASIKHYKETYGNVPPWIAVNGVYFGSIINWYKILDSTLKVEIANDFFSFNNCYLLPDDSKIELLVIMMNLLQKYRNNIAHGNRIFESNVSVELSKNLILTLINDNTILSPSEFNNELGKKDYYAVILTIISLINDIPLLENFIYDFTALIIKYTQPDPITNEAPALSKYGDFYETLKLPKNTLERIKKYVKNK